MAFIWINPVTDSMYEPEVLNIFLAQHGYKRFKTNTDWLAVVREKYRLAVEQATHTVMDMRCPKCKELLEELGITSKVTIPEIEPILIHCGREVSEQEELENDEKIITTPCQVLADMGNSLGLKDTLFVPWNKFLTSLGDKPTGIKTEKSPIPPGYFDELRVKTVSITGEDEIRDYFNNNESNKVQLVEMLYCKDGCHNGDGVRVDEAKAFGGK